MGPGETILRLAVAAALGSLIGLDRQRFDKAAGLRTHMLVSVGSALVMIVSAYGFDPVLSPGRVTLDPSRVAAQVVSGVGFLGAGAILQRKKAVHGLTTAAGVWAVAAIGLAAGGGLFVAATAATVLMLLILSTFKPLEQRISGHRRRRSLTLRVEAGAFTTLELVQALTHGGLSLHRLKETPIAGSDTRRIEVQIGPASDSTVSRLLDRLRAMQGVVEVGLRNQVDDAAEPAVPGL